MVNKCIRDDRPLSCSHGSMLLRAVSDEQTLYEVWQSNQSTDRPIDVFCMGPCEKEIWWRRCWSCDIPVSVWRLSVTYSTSMMWDVC